MPEDEIQTRLARIYAAIGEVVETDLSEFPPRVEQAGNRVAITQDFMGNRSQAQIENLAHSVIQNVASFPDHLRRWCRANGVPAGRLDELAEASFDLKVIIDLWNNDKHGYPPRDGGKSGRAPHLAEGIETLLEMSAPPGGGMVGYVGFQPVGSPGATHRVLVTGNVSDGEGVPIGLLHEIETRALDACERMWARAAEAAKPTE